MATQALHQIESIFSGDESNDTVAELRHRLAQADKEPRFQLQLLSNIPVSKPRFFRSILQWRGETEPESGDIDSGIESLENDDFGEDDFDDQEDLEHGDMADDDLALAFDVLVEFFKKEKAQLSKIEKAARINATIDQEESDSRSYAIVHDFLKRWPSVFDRGELDSDNLLHALCRYGTEILARAVIDAIEGHSSEILEEKLQNHNSKNGETPLKTALYVGNAKMIELLACYDDANRPIHVLNAVTAGKLEQLKVLLRSYDGNEEILGDGVFLGAAKAGHVDVWEFLTAERPEAANNVRLLQTAIKHHKMGIIHHLLRAHVKVLENLDDATDTAAMAEEGVEDTCKRLREAEKKLKTEEDSIAAGGGDRRTRRKLNKGLEAAQKEHDVASKIRNILLESLVRILKPRDVKFCWPSDPGQAPKEACLELNVSSSRTWSWFIQFVKIAEEEVRKWEEKVAAQKPPASQGNTDAGGQYTDDGDPEKASGEQMTHQDKQPKYPNVSIKSQYNVGFQPCLQYVSFPDLDVIRRQRCAEKMLDHHGQEVKYVLQWLRRVKGVRKILKLHVLDSYHHPHAEEVIEDALDGLHVEELDWKRVDLSIRTVSKAAKDVKKLHLYSSGSWTPLCHWMSADGINSLGANYVHIAIIRDGIEFQRVNDQKLEMEAWLAEKWHPKTVTGGSNGQKDEQGLEKPSSTVECASWTTAGPPRMDDQKGPVARDARTVVKLKDFVSSYHGAHRRRMNSRDLTKRPRRVKVAIIDTGIDESEFGAKDMMDSIGATFSETGDSHWWLSADSHGTQMAKLVSAIDPCCQLYIAKVGDSKKDITIGAVINALKWVTKQEVDVISMSFALNYGSDELEAAIKAAAYQGIVMVSSTADDGDNKPKVWPATYEGTLGIAACDQHGSKTHYATSDTEFYFQGERIIYESLQGSEFREEISGSSVATAIAAGVASLYLSCCAMDGEAVAKDKRAEKVRAAFYDMIGRDKKDTTKYVRPWVVFGEDQRGAGETLILPESERRG